MKQYDSYKDSDVEWIGEVPSHWEVVPFKRAITINNGCDYKHVQVEENGYPVIGSGGQFAWANQYMYDGEAVLLGRKGTIDKPMYYNGKFWTVDTMFYGISKKNAKCKYLYYQAKIIPFERYATATALPSMTQTDLNNNRICLPPIDEQSSIATYLDKKCSEIDNVISAQQKRIALLQELKQSVITHAVTKGLDPNVEIKDSGVEWIGEVPSHWEIMAIKHLIDLLTDYDANGSFADISKNCNINNGNPYAWMVRTTDLVNKRYGIVDGNNYCDLKTYKYLKKSSLFPNDIIIAKRGDIGKVFLIPNMSIPMTLAPNTYLLKTKKGMVYNVFLFYVLSSECGQISLSLNNKSTTLGAIYKDDVKAISIPVPPLSEQKVIATYLDKKCASIDSSISKAQHQVELLQEYKQSLITEVVTGKRKVS